MPELRALVVDWGGVLTEPLDSAIRAWAEIDGVDFEQLRRRSCASGSAAQQGELAARQPGGGAGARRDRGAALRGAAGGPAVVEATGVPIDAAGLLQRMFDQFEHEPAMAALVLRAKPGRAAHRAAVQLVGQRVSARGLGPDVRRHRDLR